MLLKQSANSVAGYLHFLWAGLAKHGQTGGIVPSQRFLIARMLAPVPATYRGRVIELGAGNGALTLRLAARCPAARILACEINSTLARDVRGKISAAGLSSRVEVFGASAVNLLSELGEAEKPDFIISGIAPENHSRVFGMFERINSAADYEGTGIGLTIVRKAAERMGARLGFESELGEGSRFWIELQKA